MSHSISPAATQATDQPSVLQHDSLLLHSVISELRKAVDHQLDQLVRSRAQAPQVIRGLARLEGLLDIFCDYAKELRPSDVLAALHADLIDFNAEVSPSLSRPSLGAYLQQRPSQQVAVPDRSRIDEKQRNNVHGNNVQVSDVFGENGVVLQPSPIGDPFSQDGVRLQPSNRRNEEFPSLELRRGLV